jgi:hypothetical protein
VDLTEILKEFGHGHGIAVLELDSMGRAELLLDGAVRLVIEHRPDEGAVYLRVPLALQAATGTEQVRLYRRLLAANLSGEAWGGGVFSFDAEEELIELHRRLALDRDLDTLTFAAGVDGLYGAARHAAAELGLAFPAALP